MNTPIVHLPIDSITVGDRLRDDMGDISALANSIQEHGLLHPITVDDNDVLIAGGRRLAAMRKLGFETVPARRWQTLNENDRRLIELEENLQRKDLTAYERSKNVAEIADVAATVDRETGEITRSDLEQVSRGSRGPDQTPGSIRRVSERTNIPTTSIHRAQEHVAAAERYPMLQSAGWKQYRAMEAAEALDRIPEEDRDAVVNMVSEPGIDPQTAVKIISNVANKPATERKQILDLAASEDDRDRTLAKTRAVELPPMPDGRAIQLESVIRTLRTCIKAYPDDPEVEDLKRIISDVKTVMQSIKERHQSRVESAA